MIFHHPHSRTLHVNSCKLCQAARDDGHQDAFESRAEKELPESLFSVCSQTEIQQDLTRRVSYDMTMRPPILRRKPPRLHLTFVCCIYLFIAILPASAIWPFPPKRFNGNALLTAGSMGVDDDGRVVAFGDFNGDQL